MRHLVIIVSVLTLSAGVAFADDPDDNQDRFWNQDDAVEQALENADQAQVEKEAGPAVKMDIDLYRQYAAENPGNTHRAAANPASSENGLGGMSPHSEKGSFGLHEGLTNTNKTDMQAGGNPMASENGLGGMDPHGDKADFGMHESLTQANKTDMQAGGNPAASENGMGGMDPHGEKGDFGLHQGLQQRDKSELAAGSNPMNSENGTGGFNPHDAPKGGMFGTESVPVPARLMSPMMERRMRDSQNDDDQRRRRSPRFGDSRYY